MKKSMIYLFIFTVFTSFDIHAQSCDELNFSKFLNTSTPCHHDVRCPIGDDWEHYKEHNKKSVVAITRWSGTILQNQGTGVLINNTSQNGAPYILTALHNIMGEFPEPNNPNNDYGLYSGLRLDDYNISFDWISTNEDPDCAALGVDEATSPVMTLCGLEVLAYSTKSDCVLLAADGDIPAGWNRVWAGWDKTDQFPTFEVGIHHPDGDVMKISRDDSGASKITLGSFYGEQWYISPELGGWEIGMVEPGSSGSPLFDQHGRVIGTLSGGGDLSQCNYNTGETINTRAFYGRFGISWEEGNGISEFLDPLGLNPDELESFPILTPPTPTGLSCRHSRGGQQLTWSQVPGAVSYTLTIVIDGCCVGGFSFPTSTSVSNNFVNVSDLNLGSFNCISWSVQATYSNGQTSASSANHCYDGTNCFGRFRSSGTEEEVLQREMEVFPNPSKGEIMITLPDNLDDDAVLNIHSIDGRVIHSYQKGELKNLGNNFSIHLKHGVYLLNLVSSNDNSIEKVIVEN